MRIIKLNKKKGIVFWITGLSGSGKTRIGHKIKNDIIKKYGPTILFSGDDIRNIFNLKQPKNLEMVTRILFSNRRKKINKNFVKLFGSNKSIPEELNLDLNKRPEQLSNEMFYKIAMKYEKLFC